jgi:DNA-binding MarR family transcriptional regulator
MYNTINAFSIYPSALIEGVNMNTEMIELFREKLRQLEREVGWSLKNDTQCCGISMAQCHALLEIGKKEEISIVELAEILGLDTSTLSRTIDNMVKAGLVERLSNPNDRRYVALSLTNQGKDTFTTIEEMNNNYFSQIFQLIPEEKHDRVLESVTLLAGAIKQCKDQCCK